MADQGDLLGIFSTLKLSKAPVRLFNTYRGMPFNHPADILHVDQGLIAARVHRHQVVSMASQGQTHLQNTTLPEVIRARVVEVNYKKKQAVLGEFAGVGDAVGKRSTVRVQPGESIEAQVTDGRRWIRGRMADISTNGMCIFSFSESMYTLSFALERDIYVDFQPPGADGVVRFMGVITNIRQQTGSDAYRIGLKIFPTPEIQPLLEDYITRQQQAILREIELEYQSMCREDIAKG